jgi:Tol biopolymer transport system component
MEVAMRALARMRHAPMGRLAAPLLLAACALLLSACAGDRASGPARLLFLSHPDRSDRLLHEIYVVNADGTGLTRVARFTNSSDSEPCPVWSPDGKRIAFAADHDGHVAVFLVNADGSGLALLTNTADDDTLPQWLPDGKRLAVVSHRDKDLYLLNADGSGRRRLTEHANIDIAAARPGRRTADETP